MPYSSNYRSGYRRNYNGTYRKSYRRPYNAQTMSSSSNRWIQGAVTLGGLASKVATLASLINVEKKYLDTQAQTVNASSTGVVSYLSGIAQGDDQSTRDGISIKAKYISVRMSAVIHPSATASIARIIIFIDNDNQGALPGASDVLDQVNVNGMSNQFNGSRFRILYDRQLMLNQVDLKNWLPEPDGKGVYRKLDMHIKYRGSSAAVASAGENSIWILTLSNEATNVPSVTYSSRIRFIDN